MYGGIIVTGGLKPAVGPGLVPRFLLAPPYEELVILSDLGGGGGGGEGADGE